MSTKSHTEHQTPGPLRSPQEESELASLFRAAGPRPAPPERDKEIVKAATLAQWQWTVRRRSAFVVLAAAAALVFVAFQPVLRSRLGLGTGPVAGILEIAQGQVWGSTGGTLEPLAAGTVLPAGFVLETPEPGAAGAASRAVLQLAGGSSLRLDAGSRLRLISGDRLVLDRGAVYVDSGPAGGPVAIATPLGDVRDIGTRFEVRLEPGATALRIRVRDGEVELEHQGQTHSAGAGQEMLQRSDGTLARSEVEAYGPAWAWVAATLPPFETQGRSLAEFLSWAAREGGWELSYEDPALGALAAEVVLYGSVRGHSLEEAIAAMLAGSDLAYHLDGGALVVERRPDSNF